jgi:signal peptidase II
LVLDQVTKAVARANMHVGDSVEGFIPGLINLTMVRNSGAAFGIFPGQRPVFVLTSLLVLFVIAAYWRRARPRQWPVVIAFATIAGGAIGNLIDRALIGYVTDFFEFSFVQFPVFNIADMGLVCGVGILMIWILFGPQPDPRATTQSPDSSDSCDALSAPTAPRGPDGAAE